MKENHVQELIDKYIDYSFSVTRKVESLIRKEIGDDLTTEQHYTLKYVQAVDGCTSTELAEEFGVKKSAITGTINRLVERGLIDRKRDEGDRRVIYLSLTEKGHSVFNKTQQKVQNIVETIITKFEQAEIDEFMRTYEKLNQVLIDIKQEETE
ncbi:MarR family winged helix-turn-helix transcriptional regulator [Bacillus pinisoli]|uniref:MarR family winged helix-turn-helix transcriptional regulator n=1 Tax=Bacillus pinisoli TaxID=2901866 RepID=UPI001FF4BDEB|nr:MarR family transcriptional regulator [Bacillus pinisoli]